MEQEEKKLLVADLSARLLYRVKGIITYNEEKYPLTLNGIYDANTDIKLQFEELEMCYVEDFLPYLRPMPSMSEEERKEYWSKCDTFTDPAGLKHYFKGTAAFDWLNSHHFDYRGLIPRGLALEAPEDMYNIKNV